MIVIVKVALLYATEIGTSDVSGRISLTLVDVTVAASSAFDISTVGTIDMLTPVAPAAGFVERISGAVVVVNVQVDALPMGTPSDAWTDPLTDAV